MFDPSSPPEISIVHISDPHWINRANINGNQDAAVYKDEYHRLSKAFKKVVAEELTKLAGRKRVLVHTGDSANFYDYNIGEKFISLEEQFEEIKKLFIDELLLSDMTYDHKFAVPGNHDIDHAVVGEIVLEPQMRQVRCIDPNGNLFQWDKGCFKGSIFTVYSKDKNIAEEIAISDNTGSEIDLERKPNIAKMGDKFSIKLSDRLSQFRKIFSDWSIIDRGQREKEFEVEISGGRKICFVLFDTAQDCGVPSYDGQKTIQVVGIPKGGVEDWKRTVEDRDKKEKDAFRIALLHHGTLPNSNNDTMEAKGDNFYAEGRFNKDMIETDVRLILSGHNHFGEELHLYQSKRNHEILGPSVTPYIESGFIFAAAPTFLRTTEVAAGFNVFDIFIDEGTNMARVQITKYRIPKETHTYSKTIQIFPLALKTLNPSELKVLRASVDKVYSGESLESLERILDLEQNSSVPEIIKTQIKHFEAESNNVLGIYCSTAMPPETWWANGLVYHLIRPFRFYRSQAKIADLDGSGRGNLVFEFSKSLWKGIYTSHQGQKYFENKYPSSLNEPPRKHGQRLTPSSIRPLRDHEKIIEKNLTTIAFGEETRDIIALEGDWDIPMFMHDMSHRPKCMELARILLWEEEEFDSPYAHEIIDFHRSFSVPLFWLDPNRLQTKLSHPKLRARVGCNLLCSFSEPAASGLGVGKDISAPMSYLLNTKANEGSNDLHKSGQAEYLTYADKTWGQGGYPVRMMLGMESRALEWRLLLDRPDLLFAADVLLLRQAPQGQDALRDYLKSKDVACEEWMNKAI